MITNMTLTAVMISIVRMLDCFANSKMVVIFLFITTLLHKESILLFSLSIHRSKDSTVKFMPYHYHIFIVTL